MDIADILDWGPWYRVLKNWREGSLTKKELVQAIQSGYDVPEPAKELLCDAVLDSPKNKLVHWARGPKSRFESERSRSFLLFSSCDRWRDDISYFREHRKHEFDHRDYRPLANEIERRASLKGKETSATELAVGIVSEMHDENYYTLRDRYLDHNRMQAIRLARHFIDEFNATEEQAVEKAVELIGSTTAKAVLDGLKSE